MIDKNIPKATLHEHLTATITPERALKIAARNNIAVPEGLISEPDANNPRGSFNYDLSDINNFFWAYDTICNLVINPIDYYEVLHDFLTYSAGEGAVLAEFQVSPMYYGVKDKHNIIDADIDEGMYKDIFSAITKAMDDAEKETGIISSIVAVSLRSWGNRGVMKVLDFIEKHPHPLYRGFGFVENESFGRFADYDEGIKRAIKEGYRFAPHAGEQCGPQSLWDVLEYNPERIGHGIRAIEDAALVKEIVDRDITLEVCLTSNHALLPLYKDSWESHPIRKLYDAGVKITLACDDAGMFGTSVGREYEVAKDILGFTDEELKGFTKNALAASFLPEEQKNSLRKKTGL